MSEILAPPTSAKKSSSEHLVVKKQSEKRFFKKRNIENFAWLILSFLLSMFLAVTVVLCLLQLTIFDQSFLRRQIERSGYSDNVMYEVQETLSSFGMGSGFSEGFFADAVSRDMLRADIFREVSRIYEDYGRSVVHNRFHENLRADLVAYVEAQNGEITYEQLQAIENLADVSTAAYVNIVSIPFTDQFYSIMSHMHQVSIWGLIVFILLDAVCVAAVLLRDKKRVSSRWKVESLMNSVAGAFLIVGIPMLLLAVSGVLRRISVSGRALHLLMQQYFSSVFQTTWVLLGILVVIWLCGLLYRQSYILSKKSGREFSL